MKRIICLCIVCLLSGCFYADGCFYSPQLVSCDFKNEKEYPSIAHYQKPDSLGHTDSAQRWKDVVSCGGKYGDYYYEENATVEEADRLYFCMIKKGYIFLMPAECGFMNPKWDKGKCNL